MSSESKSKRQICSSCSKPTIICLCNRILTPGLDNPVSITILQHSLEKKHPLNSARIVKLGLKNVTFVNVTDVIFDARFEIRSLGSGFRRYGVCENASVSSHSNFVAENVASVMDRNVIDNGADEWSLRDSLDECSVHDLDEHESAYEECIGDHDEFDFKKACQSNEDDPVITTRIEKHAYNSIRTHYRAPQIQHQNPIYDSLSKGFMVKKFQNRKLNDGIELEEYEEFELEIPPGSILLFPSDESITSEALKAAEFEVKNLIVLDGTWAKAKRMYSENPWLKLLPHLKLDLKKMSLYSEVRQQPKAGFLSTVESIVYALKGLGDDSEGLDNLLDVFESMVRDQRRCKEERLARVSSES